ncbi:MAG: tripartite tricarboxylate transporter substrate binding protein [Lautropia sp.]
MTETSRHSRRLARRRILRAVVPALSAAPAAAVLLSSPAVRAQTAATPLRIIVPYAAGGSTDVLARAVGAKMGELLGQSVVIDNRPGGGTLIAAQLLAGSPADGNTLMLTAPDLIINAFIQPNMPVHPLKDFTPVSLIATYQLVMAVPSSLSARSVGDFLRLARAAPGGFNYASAGVGSTAHLSGEQLRLLSGVPFTHVPYKGMAPAMTDLIAGRIQATFVSWITIEQYVKAGSLTALASTGTRRMSITPDLPTISESVPGYELIPWFGFIGPKGLPREALTRLNKAAAQAMAAPDVRGKLGNLGAELGASTPEAFAELTEREYEKWGKLVKAANVKQE